MNRIEPNTYSFVTKEGYEHMAVMMEEGKYKGVAWGYTRINLPKEKNGKATLSFEFEILDNAHLPWEVVNQEELMTLMGDILSDQIDEQIKTGRVKFND
jgi:hypothetical protein